MTSQATNHSNPHLNQDVTLIGAGRHTVVWHSDHAHVFKAFGNPFLSQKV